MQDKRSLNYKSTTPVKAWLSIVHLITLAMLATWRILTCKSRKKRRCKPMMTGRVYKTATLLLTSSLLIFTFFAPISLAQELTEEEQIERLIAIFASDPELGMEQLEDLAEENPGLAVLIIVELAKEIPEVAVVAIVHLAEIAPEVTARGLVTIARLSAELAETQPGLAATLKAVLSESIVQMIETAPGVAGVVVQSVKQVAPELGASMEEEAVAAGLERDYLLAASPIMP